MQVDAHVHSCTEMDRYSPVKEQLLAGREEAARPLGRATFVMVERGLVFGRRGSRAAAQVLLDVALAVANSTAELPVPAAGPFDALLRQEALADAEALGRFRGREQAVERFA